MIVMQIAPEAYLLSERYNHHKARLIRLTSLGGKGYIALILAWVLDG